MKKGIIFPQTELNFNGDQQIGTYLMINSYYRPFAPKTLLGTTELSQAFNSTPGIISQEQFISILRGAIAHSWRQYSEIGLEKKRILFISLVETFRKERKMHIY